MKVPECSLNFSLPVSGGSAVLAEAVARLRAPVGLDNVFDLPSADGTAGVGHLLEFDAARVAQTHVSAGVDDRVHHVLVTDGALVQPGPAARRERGGLGEADRGVGGGSWREQQGLSC